MREPVPIEGSGAGRFQPIGARELGGYFQPVGRRSHVAGYRSHVAGCRSHVVGCRSHVVGCRSHVVGRRPQVAGRRSYVVGCRSHMVSRRPQLPAQEEIHHKAVRGRRGTKDTKVLITYLFLFPSCSLCPWRLLIFPLHASRSKKGVRHACVAKSPLRYPPTNGCRGRWCR